MHLTPVSIRLADAWPFQPGRAAPPRRPAVHVSIRLADAWPFQLPAVGPWGSSAPPFQSALRMRGLFNDAGQQRGRAADRVSIRLADAWPFQPGESPPPPPRSAVSIRLADAWPFQPDPRRDRPLRRWLFQSALRMRGLFNRGVAGRARHRGPVSIRLADAWPFQPPGATSAGPPLEGFNPPCGCVAFSTAATTKRRSKRSGCFNPPCGCVAFSTPASGAGSAWRKEVSIRLADAWPFQPSLRAMTRARRGVSIRLADAWPFQREKYGQEPRLIELFQSALRMRGLFNARPGRTCARSWPDVSIRLADAWPFQPHIRACRCDRRRCFNPPCGCVAFSTPTSASSWAYAAAFQSALRMRGLFNQGARAGLGHKC